MKDTNVKFRRAPETKFLTIDEEVFDKLSPYALKVYGQLRKLTSYTKENDETEITVKNLARASGISERKTYDCLNELEHQHHIIQRHNVYHIRYGQINTFDVSQTYGYFKDSAQRHTQEPPPAQHADPTEPVDNCVQNLTGTAQYAEPPAQYAVGTARRAYLYKEQESSQELFKKQNKRTVKPPVSVFSCTESVKDHIDGVIANRDVFLEDDIIAQGIYYAYETNRDKSFDSVNKRVNIFLKKVRDGKWLIPQGFNGITYQSIREKEEAYNKNKQEQYNQESKAFREITRKVQYEAGGKALGEILKKLRTG